MLATLMFSVVAEKSRTLFSLSYSADEQELGGSIARQLAQVGQQKYSIPWTSCSVYKWGLAGGQGSLFFLGI